MTSNPKSKSKPRIKEHEHQTYRKKKKHEHHQIKEHEHHRNVSQSSIVIHAKRVASKAAIMSKKCIYAFNKPRKRDNIYDIDIDM